MQKGTPQFNYHAFLPEYHKEVIEPRSGTPFYWTTDSYRIIMQKSIGFKVFKIGLLHLAGLRNGRAVAV